MYFSLYCLPQLDASPINHMSLKTKTTQENLFIFKKEAETIILFFNKLCDIVIHMHRKTKTN